MVLPCSLAWSWAGLMHWPCPLPSEKADPGREYRQVRQILGDLR